MRTGPPIRRTPAWHRWKPQWVARDRSWSQRLHRRATARPLLLRAAVGVSHLSDGMIWYAAILLLPWFGGPHGSACALRMLGLGVLNLIIYTILKRHFARPRPYVDCPDIRACARSLDEYSFPSGHAMHAVAFSSLLVAYYPVLAWVLWPFAAIVALSRVVLGLHYPSDVAVGAVLGWLTAKAMLVLLF
ncbi:MAG TPA: phosphatase PAP2 family protein [Burkholderiaceae bacterium]|nr:phosphatase PAP2 family protein [Burkholderiaceae bacterium]